MEVSSALYQVNGGGPRPALINKIYGLGGRDYMPDQGEQVFGELNDIAGGAPVKAVKEYLGVRE
jgi:pyruvate ferredoxin oxidoreductase alpha subunit